MLLIPEMAFFAPTWHNSVGEMTLTFDILQCQFWHGVTKLLLPRSTGVGSGLNVNDQARDGVE
jgi:hypothetical protein